jgi:hypothetical protein
VQPVLLGAPLTKCLKPSDLRGITTKYMKAAQSGAVIQQQLQYFYDILTLYSFGTVDNIVQAWDVT